MKNHEIFMSLEEIGNVYIYDILIFYIYPRVFVCQDEYEGKYLFNEITEDLNHDKWLVLKIKKSDYYKLIDGKISIQNIFKSYKNSVLLVSKEYFDDKEDVITCRKCNEQEFELLGNDETYINKEIDDISSETLKNARDNNSVVFDIRFYQGSDRHTITCGVMQELCESIKQLFNNIKGIKKEDELRVSTAPGSCIVRFTFPEQINLFGECNAIDELKIMNEVMRSNDFLESVSQITQKKEFITNYTKFLKAMKKSESNVQFISAFPTSDIPINLQFSKKEIFQQYEKVSRVFETTTDNVDYIAKIVAWDVKQKKFKAITNEQNFSGDIDSSIRVEKIIDFTKKYKLHLQLQTTVDQNNYTKKEKYILLELEDF